MTERDQFFEELLDAQASEQREPVDAEPEAELDDYFAERAGSGGEALDERGEESLGTATLRRKRVGAERPTSPRRSGRARLVAFAALPAVAIAVIATVVLGGRRGDEGPLADQGAAREAPVTGAAGSSPDAALRQRIAERRARARAKWARERRAERRVARARRATRREREETVPAVTVAPSLPPAEPAPEPTPPPAPAPAPAPDPGGAVCDFSFEC